MSIWSVALGLAGVAFGFAVAWLLAVAREGRRLAAAETATFSAAAKSLGSSQPSLSE